MTTPWSSEEPSAAAAGESEQDFPAQGPDDGVEDPAGFDPKRATAAAAYGKAIHNAPAPEPGERPAEGVDPEQQVQSDIDELSAKAELADEYLLIAQRTQADFENYRKRIAKESAAAQERGTSALAKELLPALDNLDRALEAAAADDPLLEGVRLVRSELSAGLARVGIKSFSPAGEPFDPALHEAVATAQAPEGLSSGTVIEVYQPGYRLGASIIRPARVVVAG